MDQTSDEFDALTTNEQAANMLATIAADMERDAELFEGQPFNGKTVAAYLGNLGAGVAAVAKILAAALLSDAPDCEDCGQAAAFAPPDGALNALTDTATVTATVNGQAVL